MWQWPCRKAEQWNPVPLGLVRILIVKRTIVTAFQHGQYFRLLTEIIL